MANMLGHRLKTNVLKNLRSFYLSVSQNGQAKMMKKVMGGSAKKKFKYHETPILPNPITFSKGAFEGKRSIDSKRSMVLNKLFMRYITDLMSTGECSSEFVGHGIEISRVQVTPDFNSVHVFWIAKGTEKDNVIEEILHKNTGSLRHELAQLKVVGVIPKIKFIKDKQYAQSVEVDRLLSQADFGEDYIPVDLSVKLKTELELNTHLQPHVVKQIQELDNDECETRYEEPLPPMPNNVFGLNHLDIMERVQKSKQKSQALHRLQPEENMNISQSTNENPLQFTSVQEERKAFKLFLQNRQIVKDKTKKLDKNYRPELEYMKEEWLKQQQECYSSYNKNDEEKDFIDEDINSEK